METLDSPILLSRSFEKCVAAFVGHAFQFVPFLACEALYLPRGLQIEGALKLCLRVRCPSRTERKHVRGVGTTTSLLWLNAHVGVAYYIIRENLIWRFFNDSPNRQIKVLAKFSGCTVLVSPIHWAHWLVPFPGHIG